MVNNMAKLYEDIRNKKGTDNISKIEIPIYITENINKDLRDYQEDALKYFYADKDTFNSKHLMFNMATGSGKTLVMASLILEYFKQGYRKFIFFVNSSSIVEKTKLNFADSSSSKYLYSKNIIIDHKNIDVKAIDNFNDFNENNINIYFTTIQGLYSSLVNERENSLTFNDFENEKFVFLADEAHHLNADTKKGSKQDEEDKKTWEGIIKEAFKSNEKENVLLEFSATIPKDLKVLEKYQDKIIYEYDLAKFSNDGYSKRIFLMKYENDSLNYRFLGGILLNLYRELVALKENVVLKPVILFKSESISLSIENHELFIEFIKNIDKNTIKDFYDSIDMKEGELIYNSKVFFENEFGNLMYDKLVEYISNNYRDIYILNTNNDSELEKNQILLNTLEDVDNHIRVIFTVDKLNEGWDVLNLFDIVRLGNKKASSAVTTKEAQLIGRGARYFPFVKEGIPSDLKFKRKFDDDANNQLSAIERLMYHTLNDVDFIKNLNKAMIEKGMPIEGYTEHHLKINDSLKDVVNNNKIYHITNQKVKKKEISRHGYTPEEIETKLLESRYIPLFSNVIEETEEKFKGIEIDDESYILIKLKDRIESKFIEKAMNIENLSFSQLKKIYGGFHSKKDFCDYIGKYDYFFDRKQEFTAESKLQISKYIIRMFKDLIEKINNEYDITDFEVKELKITDRVIVKDNKSENIEKRHYDFDWLLYQDMFIDSNLENEFILYVEANNEKISKVFSEWFFVRNEGFHEFKLFDSRSHESSYGIGFEPDFIFFGKYKDSDKFLCVECIVEVKGEHLVVNDNWKESFLAYISDRQFNVEENKIFNVEALPFFRKVGNREYFEIEFNKFQEKYLNR